MNVSWLKHRPGFFMAVGAAIVSLALTVFNVTTFTEFFNLDWYQDETGLTTATMFWFFCLLAFGNIFLAKYINAQGGFQFTDYLSKSFALYTLLFLMAYVLIVGIAAVLTNGYIILFKFQNLWDLLVGSAVTLGLMLAFYLVPFFLLIFFNFCLIKLDLRERAKKCLN